MITYKPMKDRHFCEIGQQVPFRFAFISANNEQCHPFVRCRDFLQDAVRSMRTGKVDEIYGFKYVPDSAPPIDVNKMRLLVTNMQPAHVETALRILHTFESKCSLPLSSATNTQENGVYYFIGAKAWVNSPFLISMYTFLIRLGYKKWTFTNVDEMAVEFKKAADGCKGHDNDLQYMTAVHPHLFKIVERRAKHSFTARKNYVDLSIGEFHNHSGIWSLVKGSVYPESFAKTVKEAILK